ncbi:polyprenyl synthetase family protein [Streptomyces sp. T-3]|nr:polyprenyl synthetase family protein [Streptomyces sp. T-3]
MTSTPPTEVPSHHGQQLLEQASLRVRPELRDRVESHLRRTRPWAGYHLGWLDGSGRPATARTGKAVRPALVFACAEAVGGRARDALEAAAAVELVHDFSLVHDDIMDGDRMRRHRSTVWAAFGTSAGLLTGDALLSLAYQCLADTPGRHAGRSLSVLAATVVALIEGQAQDLAFERRGDVTPEEYTEMAAGKTGALFGCACALGALAGGAGDDRAERLACFGRHVGVAFQIADDLIGLLGDPAVSGKPVGSDLAARKKTLPVVTALTSRTPAGRALAALYAERRPLTGQSLRRAVRLVEEAGGVQAAHQAIDHQLAFAHAALNAAEPSPPARRDLTALARVLTRRES